MIGWIVRYFHITSYLTESSVNAIHEDTLRRISPIRFVHSSKYDRYYTHLVFYDFMCVCLFRFHVKHINCILCSRRHVIKFLQSLRESAGRGIQCKEARNGLPYKRKKDISQIIAFSPGLMHFKCIKPGKKAIVSDKNSWDTSTQRCLFTSGPSPCPPNVVYRG